jgi:DNA-binding CsgD family transcriptional regulator
VARGAAEAAAYASVAVSTLRPDAPDARTAPPAASTTEEPASEASATPAPGPDEAEPVLEFRRPQPVHQPGHPKLTEQELKVVRLVAEGLTNPEIGARLGLSRHTVKEYLSHAMRKLEAANRVEAVRRAGSLGLLDGPETGAITPREDAASTPGDRAGEPPVESSDLKVPAVKIGRLPAVKIGRLPNGPEP